MCASSSSSGIAACRESDLRCVYSAARRAASAAGRAVEGMAGDGVEERVAQAGGVGAMMLMSRWSQLGAKAVEGCASAVDVAVVGVG